MKKSNLILFGIVIVASVFLLWLWYFLGFSMIDSPLDLVMSIVWWALIAVLIVAISRVEAARRKRIRTIYVGDNGFFNSEKGFTAYADREQMMRNVERTLQSLEYDFDTQDIPDRNRFHVKYLIRSKDYGKDAWKGEVVFARSKEEKQFTNEEELRAIIETL